MSQRVAFAVGVSAVVLLAGVVPVLGVGSAGERLNSEFRRGDATGQYKVSLENVTIKTWLLRNATVLNATVERVVVRNVSTPDGVRRNVTLTNVTVGRFVIERARLKNVTARKLVVRNKSVLGIPGGSFINPDVENETIDRHQTRNTTVSGVVIDSITVDAAVLCGNVTLGPRANASASFGPTAGQSKPDVTVQNGTVGEALVVEGRASNWSVGSVKRPAATNATLPEGCNPA